MTSYFLISYFFSTLCGDASVYVGFPFDITSNSSGITSVDFPAPQFVILNIAFSNTNFAPFGNVHCKHPSTSLPFFNANPAT